jgi:hypothetical protein
MDIEQYIQELDKNEDKKRIIHEQISKAKREQEFENAGSGSYTSSTGKKVFVKRINVKNCLELIKSNNIEELKLQVKKWIEPII